MQDRLVETLNAAIDGAQHGIHPGNRDLGLLAGGPHPRVRLRANPLLSRLLVLESVRPTRPANAQ